MKSIERILVPVDFSACSQAAIDHAVILAEAFDASIDVLHAWQLPHAFGAHGRSGADREGTLLGFSRTQSGHALKAVLQVLEDKGLVRVRGRLVASTPKQAILEAADGGDYDLIVMGTHGRTGLSHMLLGSVAEQIVRRASIPVLTVRVPDPPEDVATELATPRYIETGLEGDRP